MGSLDLGTDRADPLVGTMLGKDYRVIEPIGFGGMAVVYLVEHQTLRKRFAAKVLSAELAANLEARARFTQEAHAASQLDHENIVGISDFGATSDHRPYFVMELLRGQTLDQRVAQGPMSIEEIVAVAVPVSRALAHAHAEGIIHRDVKPENVFLVQRSQGRFGVKVVDFGIAKTPVNTKLTKMGETLGSPMFMSPEACRGDDVDPRADLYSFGVMLYLMLCGRVPFADDNLLKVLQMQVCDPPPPPRLVNPELSPQLAALLERALAKDPDERHASMDALLKDLEAAVPPGSDRLLIEAQTGGASSFRMSTMAGQGGPRIANSQQLTRVASQPLPGHASRPNAAIASSSAMTTVTGRRRMLWALLAVLLLGGTAYSGWLALHDDGRARPEAPAHAVSPASAAPRASSASPEPRAAAPAPAAPEPPSPAMTVERTAPVAPGPGAATPPPAGPPSAEPPPAEPARPRRPRAVKRPPPPPPPRVERRDTGAGSAAPQGAGSAAPPKGDPELDIRLSR